MPFSTYFKNLLLDAGPDTVYAAMFTGGAPGSGTEVNPSTLWGSGSRPAVTLSAASDGARDPDGDASLGTVAVASQEVTHLALYDAATDGNLLSYAAFARTLVSGDEVYIPDATDLLSLADS